MILYKLIFLILFVFSLKVHAQVPNEVRQQAYQYLKDNGYVIDSMENGGYTYYVDKIGYSSFKDTMTLVYVFASGLEHGKSIFLVRCINKKNGNNRYFFLGTECTIDEILRVFEFLNKNKFNCYLRDKILSIALSDCYNSFKY
jgi:hypothetical protein